MSPPPPRAKHDRVFTFPLAGHFGRARHPKPHLRGPPEPHPHRCRIATLTVRNREPDRPTRKPGPHPAANPTRIRGIISQRNLHGFTSLVGRNEPQNDQSDKAQDQHAIFTVTSIPGHHQDKPTSQYDPENGTIKPQVPRACSHSPCSNWRHEKRRYRATDKGDRNHPRKL